MDSDRQGEEEEGVRRHTVGFRQEDLGQEDPWEGRHTTDSGHLRAAGVADSGPEDLRHPGGEIPTSAHRREDLVEWVRRRE